MLQKRLTEPYSFQFEVSKPGLVVIFLSARCKSRRQLHSDADENLRAEINRLHFRELPPEKYTQLFNIPAAWNGSKLKGLKQTVAFLTILEKGKHTIDFIPDHEAFIEDVHVQEIQGQQQVTLSLEEQAEDGDRRPWYTFVLVDLPLKSFSLEATTEKRLRDSDDLKVVTNGVTKKKIDSGKFFLWYLTGSLLSWLIKSLQGEKKRTTATFEESLDNGIHYIELRADRTPVLHRVVFDLSYRETGSEQRASNIIKNNTSLIITAAREFQVDPVVVGAVIYQEQVANVNFVDSLTDYIGGLLHLNTSIGVGQVRVNTARDLEEEYPSLDPNIKESWPGEDAFVRVERLKEPLTNMRYVAAKLHFSQARWEMAGFDIKDKPEILGTLYNIEEVKSPIPPRENPESNEFGKGVAENYEKVKRLLGV